MSDTIAFTEAQATLYPVLLCERQGHDVCMEKGHLRLAADAIEAGRVALFHFDDCILLERDAARKLLAQLQDALGETPRPVVAPVMPPPWTPPNPFSPFAPGKVTCDNITSTSSQLPPGTTAWTTQGDSGHHVCESAPRD